MDQLYEPWNTEEKNRLYVKTNSLLAKQVTKTPWQSSEPVVNSQMLARPVEIKMSLRGLCFIWEAIMSLQRLVRQSNRNPIHTTA